MLINLLKRVLGRLAQDRGREPAALPPREAVAGYLPTLLEQARIAHQSGALGEAIDAYDSALRLLPETQSEARAAVLVNMGAIWRERVRLSQAIACLRQALALQPGLAAAHYNLGLTLYEIGEAEAAEHHLDAALEIAPDFQAAHSTRLCLFGLGRKHDPARVLSEHRRWAEKFADPLTALAPPHLNERSTERRLTVGYVSADFKEHSVARFISPILARHDRARFRVICYDNWPRSDATTERLRALADAWRKIDTLDDRQAAELIRADGVDILVDLSGHTTGNRLLLFARKPAPVQASWLGYMCTTGMVAMDWHITDAHLDPPGVSDGWYTERLLRIACAAAFEPHPDSPPVNPLPALANGFVRFGSFNNYTKIGDEVIALWGRILAALPRARLLLVVLGGDEAEFQSDLRARFERLASVAGVSSRIDVMGKRPLKDFLRMFHEVDIALDPFPYGGGTTTLHTLWMGVPVVTLEGESELARSTSGMLNACGLGQLIARSDEEYLYICAHLAGNCGRLGELRSGTRERLSNAVLSDASLVTRGLEEGYARIWEDYVRGATEAVAQGPGQ